jgi:hypothetical protein
MRRLGHTQPDAVWGSLLYENHCASDIYGPSAVDHIDEILMILGLLIRAKYGSAFFRKTY